MVWTMRGSHIGLTGVGLEELISEEHWCEQP